MALERYRLRGLYDRQNNPTNEELKAATDKLKKETPKATKVEKLGKKTK